MERKIAEDEKRRVDAVVQVILDKCTNLPHMCELNCLLVEHEMSEDLRNYFHVLIEESPANSWQGELQRWYEET